MKLFRFVFLIFTLLLCRSLTSQTNELCRYKNDLSKYHDSILHALNVKVVKRDSLSYVQIKDSFYQRDSSQLILPDSCALLIAYYLKFAFIEKPAINYLILLEKLGSFNEDMTNVAIFEITKELTLTPTYIAMLSEHPEFKMLEKWLIFSIPYAEPGSDNSKQFKKWLKQNSSKKETEFYKKLSTAVNPKK